MKTTREQREIAKRNGISYQTLMYRIKANWKLESALGIVERVPKSEPAKSIANLQITYNNITETLQYWSEYCNISVTTLYSRLNKNWSVEETIQVPKCMSRSDYYAELEVQDRKLRLHTITAFLNFIFFRH